MRVLCKRNYMLFLVGNYYTITDSFLNAIFVEDVLFWCNNCDGDGLYYFGDYFCTIQEMRKLKLERIENESIM